MANINLYDQINGSGYANTGGTWAISPSSAAPAGGSYSIATDTGAYIDTALNTDGTYIFEYTVSITSGMTTCDDTKVATVIINTAPSMIHDECTNAISVASPGLAPNSGVTGPITNFIEGCDNGGYAPATISVVTTLPSDEQDPPSWVPAISRSGDVWYTIILTPLVSQMLLTLEGSIYGEQGIMHPQFAVYSGTCGVDTFTLHSYASNGMGQDVQVVITGSGIYYLRVAYALSGHSGTFRFNMVVT